MKLAAFVNTCDSFQDCWTPFFKLFEIYGGVLCAQPVYLNTERAEFQWNDLEVHSTKSWPPGERTLPTWCERFLNGLDHVKEDLVLYFQEDYFLKGVVRAELVREALDIFAGSPNVGVVYLNSHGPSVTRSRRHSENFLEVQPPARYLISTQAAIWRKEFLRSTIRNWENVWMFEKFGTLRARNTKWRFFAPTPSALEGGEIVDYLWTGVIQGKWKEDCPELFRQHGITVDFQRRGFYKEGTLVQHRLRIIKALYGRPVPALRSILSLL